MPMSTAHLCDEICLLHLLSLGTALIFNSNTLMSYVLVKRHQNIFCVCVCVLVTHLCLTLTDRSPPGSSVHEFSRRRLEGVAISSSRGSS